MRLLGLIPGKLIDARDRAAGTASIYRYSKYSNNWKFAISCWFKLCDFCYVSLRKKSNVISVKTLTISSMTIFSDFGVGSTKINCLKSAVYYLRSSSIVVLSSFIEVDIGFELGSLRTISCETLIAWCIGGRYCKSWISMHDSL